MEMRSAGSMLMKINQLLTSLVGACVKEVSRYFESLGSTLEEVNGSYEYRDPLREDSLSHIQPVLDMLARIKSSEYLKVYRSTRGVAIEDDIRGFRSRRDISRGFADLVQTDGVKTGHVVNKNDVFNRFILFSTELLRGGSDMERACEPH